MRDNILFILLYFLRMMKTGWGILENGKYLYKGFQGLELYILFIIRREDPEPDRESTMEEWGKLVSIVI